jgi:hypothetical protein
MKLLCKADELRFEHGFHGCFARISLNGVDLLSSVNVDWKECQVFFYYSYIVFNLN